MKPLLVIGLFSLMSLPAVAQTTTYEWYEGGVRHQLHVQSGLVAEFGVNETTSGAGLQKLSGTSVVKDSGTTKIFRLTNTATQKLSSTGMSSNQSPVFSDSVSGGVLRALPGGIIVTFKSQRDEASVRSWAADNGLEFLQMLPAVEKTLAAFKTPAGLAALETANRVRLLADVESSEPNWWTERWKGSMEPKKLSPSEVKRDQTARKGMSRRFSDP